MLVLLARQLENRLQRMEEKFGEAGNTSLQDHGERQSGTRYADDDDNDSDMSDLSPNPPGSCPDTQNPSAV